MGNISKSNGQVNLLVIHTERISLGDDMNYSHLCKTQQINIGTVSECFCRDLNLNPRVTDPTRRSATASRGLHMKHRHS